MILVSAIIALVIYSFATELPDTDEMKQYFDSRKVTFYEENLRNIVRLRSGDTIDGTAGEGLAYSRIESTTRPTLAIRYYTHDRGFGVGMTGTGIAYLETPPEWIYESIGSMRSSPEVGDGFIGYGELDENWYYFYWISN